jgi:hypothetical protein
MADIETKIIIKCDASPFLAELDKCIEKVNDLNDAIRNLNETQNSVR